MTKEQINRYARYQAALDNAYIAAEQAQKPLKDRPFAMDCGFAWVVAHDTAFQTWCRKKADETKNRRYGSKHHGPGWTFWCPGNFNGQSVSVHEAGAQAFRDALAHELQIRVESSSRLD